MVLKMQMFEFPGEKVVNGDLEKVKIEAETLCEAIKKYNQMYPQFDYNKHVEKRYQSARKVSVNN